MVSQITFLGPFLPREAMQSQSAILLGQFVRPSARPCVCLSICDVEVSWSHMLESFKNNPKGTLGNFGRNKRGVRKSGFRHTKAVITLKSESQQDKTKVTIEVQ